MDTLEMTESDFRSVRQREKDEDIGLFDSLVIIPARTNRDLHDSGYRCMGFVAVLNNEPICFLSGSSDVLHIDGISGAGQDFDYTPKKPKAWNIDCLPKSGLLNVFCSGYRLYVERYTFSSFEIFAVHENDKNVTEAEVAKKANYLITKNACTNTRNAAENPSSEFVGDEPSSTSCFQHPNGWSRSFWGSDTYSDGEPAFGVAGIRTFRLHF